MKTISSRRAAALAALALAATGVLGPFAGSVSATSTVDQAQEITDSGGSAFGYGHTAVAQTFTAGKTGDLTQLDLMVQDEGYLLSGASVPLLVQIVTVSDGAPGPTVLAATQVPRSTVTPVPWLGWLTVTFPEPAEVTSGSQYAIVLSADGALVNESYAWLHKFGDPYPAGSAWVTNPSSGAWMQSPVDMVFRTYVGTAPTSTYDWSGFLAPIDDGAMNVVKAGQGIPVRFSLGGDQGLDILASGSPSSRPVTCDASIASDPVEQTVTAGASSLGYDASTDTYTYTWKTDKAWAGTCRALTVALDDGTSHTALFRFKR